MTRILLLIVSLIAASGLPRTARAADAPEFHARGGLPNFAASAQTSATIRVAFLGGSITAQEGWRVFTLDWLKRAYPRARFEEIFAAVPGTGSDYGAMRLQRDVLRYHPDLLFVEFAVNDVLVDADVAAQMEGIVRQTWRANPRTDICFVYTVSERMVEPLLSGQYPPSAAMMEKVADTYGIPSVNFGVEVARRLAAGTLIMAAGETPRHHAPGTPLVFTQDNTHPTVAGAHLYADRLAAVWPSLVHAGAPGSHRLPDPSVIKPWDTARLVTVDALPAPEGWERLPATDPRLHVENDGRLVPPTLFGRYPAKPLEFRFRGTVLGLIGLKGPENGKFRVTVDDAPPREGTLFDSYSAEGRYFLKPWFFSKHLADTVHHVRIELLPDAIDKIGILTRAHYTVTDPRPFAINGLYLSGLLLNGELVP